MASATKKGILIGCGGFGAHWCQFPLTYLKEHSRAELVAAVDVQAEALKHPQEQLGLAAERCYTDLRTALQAHAGEADFAIVVVPPAYHEAVIDAVLEYPLDILSEKPIADTMEATVRIYQKVRAAGRKMSVDMSHRADHDKQSLEHHIKSGDYGRLDYLVGRNTWDLRKFPDWGAFRYKIPNTLLIEGTVHHFDIVRALAGANARTVHAVTWNPPWTDFEGDCNGLILMEMENGVRVFYEGALANASELNGWGQDYWRAECEGGTLELSERQLRVVRGGQWGDGRSCVERKLEAGGPWGVTLNALQFVEWLEGGPAPMTHLEDNLQCCALLFAAIESAETKQVVDVQGYLKRYLEA